MVVGQKEEGRESVGRRGGRGDRSTGSGGGRAWSEQVSEVLYRTAQDEEEALERQACLHAPAGKGNVNPGQVGWQETATRRAGRVAGERRVAASAGAPPPPAAAHAGASRGPWRRSQSPSEARLRQRRSQHLLALGPKGLGQLSILPRLAGGGHLAVSQVGAAALLQLGCTEGV